MPQARFQAAPHRRRFFAFTLAALCALLLAGCSFSCSVGGSTVSSDELAKQVEASYVDQTGIELTSITCDEVDAEVGEAINCEATNASDVDLTIEGEITAVNDDTDKVDFDWEVASAQVPGERYASEAKRLLEEQTGQPIASLSCPERVTLEPNGEFRCTLVAEDDTEYGVTVNLTDMEGGFDVKVDSEPSAGASGG